MNQNVYPKKDFMSVLPRPASSRGYKTHEVENMPPEMPNQNLYLGDEVLVAAVKREGVDWVQELAVKTGELTGSQQFRDIAHLANSEHPVLRTHDRIGRRIDMVDYHPAYHQLMAETYRMEAHSISWTTKNKRPQTGRSVLFYLWNQLENGVISCPNGMSCSIVPLLQSDPEIGNRWLSKVLSTEYDPRPLYAGEKKSVTVGMAMTEKQGGSDLRANSTMAVPTGNDREYLLTGHKYFVSAPMSDIILVTAKTENHNGISIFITPRILANGGRNSIHIQRLKTKLGNQSNATSEVELDNAIAYRIGEEGRGIREFVKHMTHFIRTGMSLGAAGIMRAAVTLAIHHTTHRKAFGSTIRNLPMMQNTLADLAIESEAATLLGFRVAVAGDDAKTKEADKLLSRILVPIAKYWNCRRVSSVTLEALECHGGMGYIEDQSIARFHREAPLNSIWEGTSAMMGLDVMRAMQAEPESKDALLEEIKLAKGGNRHFDAYVKKLEDEMVQCSTDFEPHARRMMTKIAKAMQGSLLIRQSIPEVVDAFCASRLGGEWAQEYGTLKVTGAPLQKIVDRAAIK